MQQDYSYLETPELPIETNTSIIPRRALPDPRITAYLRGRLVWGILPTALASLPPPAPEPEPLGQEPRG